MKKVVYLVHPIDSRNTIEDNIISLSQIIKKINLNHPDIVPFAPYFADITIMDMRDNKQMNRAGHNDDIILERRCFDEIWVVGDWDEITAKRIMLTMASRYEVPVVNMVNGI